MNEAGNFVAHSSKLKEGQLAPYFEGKSDEGILIKLTDFKQKKLLVYFYPKDSTPACTAEACSLRDAYAELKKKGVSILGVSADSEKSHQRFKQKNGLPFPLLVDSDLKIAKTFDVWGQKRLYGRIYEGLVRTSFLIDEKGLIQSIIHKVDTKNHAQQILALI